MIFRNARLEDLKLMCELWNEVVTEEYFLKTMSVDAYEEKLLNNPDFSYDSTFVVYDEEEFLGFVASKKDDDIENCWYLDSLHINKACRGKGIGTKLIKKVGQYAMHQGYEHMSICIVKGNDNAKNIYERLGAVHYKDFIDDFGGTKSNSQKLIWKDLSIFS